MSSAQPGLAPALPQGLERGGSVSPGDRVPKRWLPDPSEGRVWAVKLEKGLLPLFPLTTTTKSAAPCQR